ncbi:hypothetical protein D3C85_731340 [compost metagenome]
MLCKYVKRQNIFKRKQKNRKKEKESNFTRQDAVRPKGIGISPEGWLVRYEQGIMPKSFCQTENSLSYLRFLFLFLEEKYTVRKNYVFNAIFQVKLNPVIWFVFTV